MVDINEISQLINLKQEGSYWDFKRQWYSNNKKGDLLHDIICMANNLTDKDGLIIIGVDEENKYNVIGVQCDENRKDTQKITDFLKSKKFAGDIRPTVYVETFKIHDLEVDVIVIKNDKNTPYYLNVDYLNVKANYIYTRIQDSNTAKDSSADINNVEKLWKKRFGLSLTAIEKVEKYIENYKDWSDGLYGEHYKYYNIFPEFTIIYEKPELERNGYEYYLFSQYNYTPDWYDIKIMYHQTILEELGGVCLDGGRYFTPCPLDDEIIINNEDNYIHFKYMDKTSLLYKLNELYYFSKIDDGAWHARRRFFTVVLLFENEIERLDFKNYVVKNLHKKDELCKTIHFKEIPNIEGYRVGAFQKEYDDALILNKMLEEFRDEKTINTYKEEI